MFLDFPWGLISSVWINTPVSQSLALFGPYWLSGITILSAFLISRPWFGSILSISLIVSLYSFGVARLNEPLTERLDPIKVRIVQPNIKQSEKWKPALANNFLNKHIKMSITAKSNEVDLIVWPETAVSYLINNEKNLRTFISDELGLPLILGGRRFDKENNKLYNSAFVLGETGNVS